MVAGNRQPLVDGAFTYGRAVDPDDRLLEIDRGVPAGDGPILGREQEPISHKAARAVENRTGWRSAITAVWSRDLDDELTPTQRRRELQRLSGPVVERCHVAVVIGDPHRGGRPRRDSPRVDQVWIKGRRHPWQVGHEIGLVIRAL